MSAKWNDTRFNERAKYRYDPPYYDVQVGDLIYWTGMVDDDDGNPTQKTAIAFVEKHDKETDTFFLRWSDHREYTVDWDRDTLELKLSDSDFRLVKAKTRHGKEVQVSR